MNYTEKKERRTQLYEEYLKADMKMKGCEDAAFLFCATCIATGVAALKIPGVSIIMILISLLSFIFMVILYKQKKPLEFNRDRKLEEYQKFATHG